ncbi:MAG TPA: hypothetical protein VKY22_30030 [Bradyrhizobium sp.]|nr:hypothetical protein [Bradyrhizobium sp.]
MLERAFPLPHPEIVQKIANGEDHRTCRSGSTRAFPHDLAGRLARMLHAVGAFFAEGGALS